jgi:hypothetical protein
MYSRNLYYKYKKPKKPYKINIKVQNTKDFIDSSIMSLSKFMNYDIEIEKIYKKIYSIMKENKLVNSIFPHYLWKSPSLNYVENSSETDIVSFKFNDITGFRIYTLCYKYITKIKNKCLLITGNTNIISGLYYLYVYILQINPSFSIYLTHLNNIDKIDKECKRMNISYEIFNTHSTGPINCAIIDSLPYIAPLNKFGGIFSLIGCNQYIMTCLKRLVKGGEIIIVSNNFTDKVYFQYYSYLSYFFNKIVVKRISYNVSKYLTFIIVCSGYNGSIDMQPLLDLEATIYKYNPNGYTDYKISDNKGIDILKNNGYTISDNLLNDGTYTYITNFMDIKESSYKKIKKFQEKLMEINLYNAHQYEIISTNDNIKLYFEQIKLESILIAKKYKLPLKEWIYISKDVYNNSLVNEFSKLFTNKNYKLKYIKKLHLGNYSKIKIFNEEYINNALERVKFSYNYVEQYDKKYFDDIERWFDIKFKKLNKYLYQNNIKINGMQVGRAWVKLYEMLSNIKILEECMKDKKINIFHTCEAPGNFINAITYYVKKNMKEVEYKWNSQTLKNGVNDVYGFINKTRDQWDYGVDGSGDITCIDNINYYYNKYKGCDMYVSDCGWGWNQEKNKLTLFQLIYALIIPRIGGGFIIKIQNCAYLEKIEISLIYLITHKYKHVNICGSNTNFWTSEIYIIGYDKIEITNEEHKNILKCIEPNNYPVKKIKSNFMTNISQIINIYISQAINFRTYFLFLSENKKIFNDTKKKYEIIIEDHINKWIEKYMI